MKDASFCLADAARLPFKNKTFDFVSVSFALHDKDAETRSSIVSEMKRVVKQDGALILADFTIPLPRNIWGVVSQVVEYIAGGSHHRGFQHYASEGGLIKIMQDHGLIVEKSGVFKGGILTVIKTICS